MQKLGRHVDVGTVCKPRVTVKLLVVISIDESKLFPWMKHFTFLGIPARKLVVVCCVPTAFVAIVPKQNARMINVTTNNLPDQTSTGRRVVGTMPAASSSRT